MGKRMAVAAFVLLVFCLSIFPGALHAQGYRALISGQVNDPSGKVIPDATVTATMKTTGMAYTSKTNAAGAYILDYLLPGAYQLTAQAPGFQRKVYSDVTLYTGQKLGLNITLTIGRVMQEVTVTASPGLLDTATATNSDVVTQEQAENTGSANRQTWMNVSFAQGVRGLGNPFNLSNRNNSASFTVNGAPKYTNSFTVNGAPVSAAGSGGKWDFSPNEDAVKEVQVTTNSYDARFGHAAGGSFNVSLKSGTNGYHGDVYEYLDNEALDAQSWTADLYGEPKGKGVRNVFGGVFGGPVRRDKVFFFGAYEGYRQFSAGGGATGSNVQTVPASSWRIQPDGSVNFSGSGYTVYDPLTVHCVKKTTSGCSQYGRNAFPNDTLPGKRISPIGASIMSFFPAPNVQGLTDNRAVPSRSRWMYNQYLGRMDETLSENTRLYQVFAYQNANAWSLGNGLAETDPASTHSSNPAINVLAIADFTHTFSPSIVGDFRASFVRATNFNFYGNAVAQNFTADKLGLTMPDVPTTTHLDIVPQINVQSFMPLFDNRQNGSVNNFWDFKGTLAQVKGNHVLHYGGGFLDEQRGGLGIPGTPNGSFSFNGDWTRKDPLKGSTNDAQRLADMLLGYPSGGSVSWVENNYVVYHTYSLFAQDDWRVRPNLTLNIGLRYDISSSPVERYDRINGGFCFTCTNPFSSQVDYSQFPNLPNPLLGTLTYAGVNGTPSAPFQEQFSDLQPRFGLAYAFRPWMVFRGGFGIYYNYGQFSTSAQGFDQTTNYINSPDGGIHPAGTFNSGVPFPNGAVAPAGANQPQGGIGVSYNSPQRHVLSSQHWSAGFQWRLPEGMLLETDYVGEHTHAIAMTQQWNVIPNSLQAQCYQDSAICNNQISNPFYGILPPQFSLGANPTVNAWQLDLPFPEYTGVAEQDNPQAYANFNAAQLRLQRKFHTLNFIFNYQYGEMLYADHYLNNGSFRDSKLWYGVGSIDRRHFVDMNVLWPLPVGQGGVLARGVKGVWSGLLSHWQADWVAYWGSGEPVPIPKYDFGGSGCSSYFPTGGQTREHWINNTVATVNGTPQLACWQSLADWERLTAPSYMSALRLPGKFLAEGALEKRFYVNENLSVQARIEAMNVLNHPGAGTGVNTNIQQLPTCAGVPVCTGFGTLNTGTVSAPRAVVVSLKIFF